MCATPTRRPRSTARCSASRSSKRCAARCSSAASGTSNHHDLGLFSVGPDAPRPERGRVGLYHLAWQVPTIQDIANARLELQRVGAYTGESDHGVSKSVYAHDPDGNEFEIMYEVPRAAWGEYEQHAVIQPLDLPAEIERFG